MSAELVLDIGHSRIKWGRVREGTLQTADIGCSASASPESLFAEIASAGCRCALISGQSRPEIVSRIADELRQAGTRVDIMSTGDRPLPVAPAYESLGCDRWLALQKPQRESKGAFVVVDSGTAITIDLVDAEGRHRGGWIMPGMESARNGLFDRAPGLLRTLPEPGRIDEPACDTGMALARGGLILAAGGIDRSVAAAERAVDDEVSLWLTGGNAAELLAHLARPARHDQHLVLQGLAMATQVT